MVCRPQAKQRAGVLDHRPLTGIQSPVRWALRLLVRMRERAPRLTPVTCQALRFKTCLFTWFVCLRPATIVINIYQCWCSGTSWEEVRREGRQEVTAEGADFWGPQAQAGAWREDVGGRFPGQRGCDSKEWSRAPGKGRSVFSPFGIRD